MIYEWKFIGKHGSDTCWPIRNQYCNFDSTVYHKIKQTSKGKNLHSSTICDTILNILMEITIAAHF